METVTKLLLLVLGTLLAVSQARPDFAVPARMVGVASGNLDSTGNVVLNTNRVLSILGQFQSITEWLYGLQTPELYQLASGFRSIMDSLVETGSPIFQRLSNAARISSGNISTVFDGVRRSINATIALNERHQVELNGTRPLLGAGGVRNFSVVLDGLTHSVANLSALLDEIEPAIVDIQRLPRPTQTLVDALYPRDAVRRLNANLQQYVNIGAATVPQINAIVNRVRQTDAFIVRLGSVGELQQSQLNSSLRAINASVLTGVQQRLQSVVRTLRTNYDTSMTMAARRLRPFTLDDVGILRQVAENTTNLLDARRNNVSQVLGELGDRVELAMSDQDPRQVMNRTIAFVNDLAWRLTLAVTTAVPRADSCFARYSYEFDKIPRLVYGAVSSCGQDELRALQAVAGGLGAFLGIVQAQLDAEARNYNRCLDGLTATSAYELKLQRTVCLWGAHRFSQHIGRPVVKEQLDAFIELLQNEERYSAGRYYECLRVADRLMVVQLVELGNSIESCVNQTST